MRVAIAAGMMALCLSQAGTAMARGAASEDAPLMWLEPMSWDEIRAQREKMKAAMEAAGQKSENGKSSGESGRKKEGGWKKGGASAAMLRTYYVRSGPFPSASMSGMPGKKAGGMSHGGMKHDGAKQAAQPQAMDHKGMRHEGMSPESPSNGKPADSTKRGSTRGGGKPGDARGKTPMENTILWVKFPDNRMESFKPKSRGPNLMVSHPSGMAGWYKLFAYNDLGVRNGTWVQLFSHISNFGHGDDVDEQEEKTPDGAGYYEGRPILELERLCHDDHACYRSHTGQPLHVRASFMGKPLANTPLTLITEQGWRQVKRTDANGEAMFVLIKETLSDETDRHQSENYLLTLEHVVEEMGMLGDEHFHNQRYVATLPMKVYQSRLEWESQSMGFLSLGGVVLVAAGAIAIRRKRRRPQA
ncbi:MAG: hypothetical protein OQJ87_06860 [Rhodospirillales bacterium]|nr:hypothetical protein [Rhodospirillales bacterium]